jgi:8-oxo-dGTP pyrophosphatase MutT (NUDIX family)
MDPTPVSDPRFGMLREALSAYASDADDPPIGAEEFLQAAVALIVRGREALDVLLIKRARHEGDPWSGHMALPGGRRAPSDASLLGTAVRETREEIGLDLERSGVHLGRLGGVAPQSIHLPRLTIAPFVFGVPHDVPAYVASREVDAVHWIPLEVLRSDEVRGTHTLPYSDGTRSFPCLNVAGEVVWGLTYRILQDFLGLLPEPLGLLPELPTDAGLRRRS